MTEVLSPPQENIDQLSTDPNNNIVEDQILQNEVPDNPIEEKQVSFQNQDANDKKLIKENKATATEIEEDSESSSEDDVEDHEDECTPEILLVRDTESFRCLAQLILSRSSVLNHPLYHFPPLEDPGIDEAFTFTKPEPDYDSVGADKYRDVCKDLNIVPLSRIAKGLAEEKLNLKFFVLNENQIRALCEALKINNHVKTLTIEETFLSPTSVQRIADMLQENCALENLILKKCQIGPEGAEMLNTGISAAAVLRELDLSYNNLEDSGLEALKNGLMQASHLVRVNLSHNGLGEKAGEILQQIFSENDSIEDLDLSWNSLTFGPGNKKFFTVLKKMDKLKRLNMSWNAILMAPAVKPISQFIARSKNLNYIDLSWNKFSGFCLNLIRRGVMKSKSLVEIDLSSNFCTPEEAYNFAKVLLNKPVDEPLKVVNMLNIYFNKDIKPVLEYAAKTGRQLNIGGILSNYDIKGPNELKVLFDRCIYILMKPKRKKQKRNFGHFILSLPDKKITKDKFHEFMKKHKIRKLDKDLLNEILNRFITKRKKIDCVQLKSDFMAIYPDTTPPPPKKKKGRKKGKKGKKKKKGNATTTTTDMTTTEGATTEGETTEAEDKPKDQNEEKIETEATVQANEMNAENENVTESQTNGRQETAEGEQKGLQDLESPIIEENKIQEQQTTEENLNSNVIDLKSSNNNLSEKVAEK